jgi:hypothetical protein
MKSLLLTIVLQTTFYCSYSQIVDKKAIDDRVKLIDTTTDKSQTRLYVINGIPFTEQDNIKIDSTLKSYDAKYLVDVNFVTCRQMNLPHCNGDIVIILFAYNQKNKTKRHLLKKVGQSFVDNYVSFSQHIFTDAKDPVLYIDNKLIHHTETKEKIKSLKLNGVYYIDFNEKPVSELHYGQNAKNGLVRIWTIPK